MAVVLVVLGAGCTTTRPLYDYAAEPDPRKQEFTLGPSDVLRVNVWRNPELSSDVTIRPDGNISLPLVGDVLAAGRTAGDVRAEISKRLQAYLKDEANNVTVSIATINSLSFRRQRQRRTYGRFHEQPVRHGVGGDRARGRSQPFRERRRGRDHPRRPGKGKKRIPINYPAILKGTHPEHDLPLVAGDIVYIP